MYQLGGDSLSANILKSKMKTHNDPELTCVRSNPQVSRLSVMPFRLK